MTECSKIIAQSNLQNKALANEIFQLKEEIVQLKEILGLQPCSNQLTSNVINALVMQKMFENKFLETVQDLRKALHQSSVKHLSERKASPVGIRTILSISDQRIAKVMEELDKVCRVVFQG
eukprot:765543-Hanusia_phi.AAC.2